MKKRSISLALIFLSTAAVVAGDTVNRWSSMASPGFSRCAAQTQCLAQPPCDLEVLEPNDGCFVTCFDPGPAGTPCEAIASAETDWQIFGFAGHFPCPGDTLPGTSASLNGQRFTDQFQIIGNVDQTGSVAKTVEISLFRFDRDPALFDGLHLTGVADLLSRGLIDPGDVLFVTEIQGAGNIAELVDVTGIPDDELVLFAVGNGAFPSETGCPVPALGPWAGAALAILLLALGGGIRRWRWGSTRGSGGR